MEPEHRRITDFIQIVITAFEGSKVESWGKKRVSLNILPKLLGQDMPNNWILGKKGKAKLSIGPSDKVKKHNSGSLTNNNIHNNNC